MNKNIQLQKILEHWFYLMEYIQGRQMEETAEDEYKIGQATRILHNLKSCFYTCTNDKAC